MKVGFNAKLFFIVVCCGIGLLSDTLEVMGISYAKKYIQDDFKVCYCYTLKVLLTTFYIFFLETNDNTEIWDKYVNKYPIFLYYHWFTTR